MKILRIYNVNNNTQRGIKNVKPNNIYPRSKAGEGSEFVGSSDVLSHKKGLGFGDKCTRNDPVRFQSII